MGTCPGIELVTGKVTGSIPGQVPTKPIFFLFLLLFLLLINLFITFFLYTFSINKLILYNFFILLVTNKRSIILFADDGKFFPRSTTLLTHDKVQEDFHRLDDWSVTSCLDFNVPKSFVLRFLLSKRTATDFTYMYSQWQVFIHQGQL